MANFTGEKAQTTLENINSVKKLQISGYPIIEYEHIPVSRLKCEHSHRNKQCSYADCRYFGGKRNP